MRFSPHGAWIWLEGTTCTTVHTPPEQICFLRHVCMFDLSDRASHTGCFSAYFRIAVDCTSCVEAVDV
jgi:hypothetical protein